VWQKLACIALAGAAGTLARYGVSSLAYRVCGENFTWGTLAVNVLGCFLFGWVWMLAEDRLVISPATRAIVLIGFMGAFTTFSTFAFETNQFLRDEQWWQAAGNLLIQNTLGLISVSLGFLVGRWF
jgi:CrcB protein